MEIIEINETERELWDHEIAKFKLVHPLNAFGWGKVRCVDGWNPYYYLTKDKNEVTGMMMILIKKIPIVGMSIMYAPKGPVWKPSDFETLKALLKKIQEVSKINKAIYLRIDPNFSEDMFNAGEDPFVKNGFIHLEHRWSFWNSPRDVYRIDLTKAKNEEELFGSIESSIRTSVRKAMKNGVTIRPAENLIDLRKFYEIFSRFSIEKGFMCRKFEYQKALWHECIEKGYGRLFLGVYEDKVIGGIICIAFGNKCLAMHMGTLSDYTKLQAYSLFIWESMKWAKQLGCTWYSFRGVGTTPKQERFKRRFNPERIALSGYYDLPFNVPLYRFFTFFEFFVLPRIWQISMKTRRIFKIIYGAILSDIINKISKNKKDRKDVLDHA